MWEKAIPVQSIEKDCFVSGNGDITIGFNLILPSIFTLSDEHAENINKGFSNLLNLLPENTTMHKLDFFYTAQHKNDYTGTNIVTKSNSCFYDRRHVLRHYSKLLFTFSSGFRYKTDKNNPYIRLSDYIFKKPFNDFEKAYEKHKNIFITVDNMLNSFVSAKRMNNEQLGTVLYEYLSQEYGQEIKGSYKDKVLPPLDTGNGDLTIGGQHVKVVSMAEEGATLKHHCQGSSIPCDFEDKGIEAIDFKNLKASMLMPLGLGLPIKHIVSVSITTRNNRWVERKLKAESSLINLQASLGYKPAKLKQEDIATYTDNVERFRYQSAEVSVNIIIPAETEEKAQRAADMAQTAFMNINGSKCWIENAESANMFMCCCPGGANMNYRKMITVTDAAAAYLLKESQYGSDSTGFVFLDRAGAPVVVDLWDMPGLGNRNELIIGGSGSGKSYLMNNLVNQLLGQDTHVIISDIGNSSKKNTYINKGRHFDSADKSKFRFNLFLCERDSSGNWMYDTLQGEKDSGQVDYIITAIACIWKGEGKLQQEEKAVLRDMVESYYQYINANGIFPSLTGFCDYLKNRYIPGGEKETELRYLDSDSLLLLLRPYAYGDKKDLLNAKENIDIINDKLVAFDLAGAHKSKDDFMLISIVMINLVIQKTARLGMGVKKAFYIDEMMDFLKDGKMSDFIAYLFRTFRKYNGKIALSGQDIEFIRNAAPEIRDSINANCDTAMLLVGENNKFDKAGLRSFLKMTDFDLELLDSVGFRKEFFIKTGATPKVYRNEVSPFADAVYTTTSTEVEKIEALENQTGDLCAAINQYIENKLKTQ